MPKRCCKTCIHSRWELTATGRIVRGASGRCVVPLPVISLPDCVTKYYSFNTDWPRTYMQPHEGTTCPLYEVNDGKPIGGG